MSSQNDIEIAVFACGCFWSKEYFFQRQKGVVSTRVGYTGGHTQNPSYSEVCRKKSGHAEAVEISFNPKKTSFKKLLQAFFDIHDARIDRRDNGGQYRSAVFYTTEKQKSVATKLKQSYLAQGIGISTQIEALDTFWEAEPRHQKYCERKGLHPGDKYNQVF